MSTDIFRLARVKIVAAVTRNLFMLNIQQFNLLHSHN